MKATLDEDYQVMSDLDCLLRAKKIQADKVRYEKCKQLAKQQLKDMKSISGGEANEEEEENTNSEQK